MKLPESMRARSVFGFRVGPFPTFLRLQLPGANNYGQVWPAKASTGFRERLKGAVQSATTHSMRLSTFRLPGIAGRPTYILQS